MRLRSALQPQVRRDRLVVREHAAVVADRVDHARRRAREAATQKPVELQRAGRRAAWWVVPLPSVERWLSRVGLLGFETSKNDQPESDF
jgi:hypothetical protein